MYTFNELLFPAEAIPTLRGLQGERWRDLIDRLSQLPESHPEVLGFSLMMIKMNACLRCETDCYRAMRGCAECSQLTLRRFRGSEADLLERHQKAVADINAYLTATAAERLLDETGAAAAA